jgi:hypothetical protein
MPYKEFNAVLEDDIGTVYGNQGAGGSPDYNYFNLSPLTALNPKPEYVTLIVTEELTQGVDDVEAIDEHRVLNGKYPILLPGDQGGTIIVSRVDVLEKETVVYYEVSESLSQHTWLTLEDSTGDMISAKGKPVRLSRDKLSFKLIFPQAENTDKLEIVSHPFIYPADKEMIRVRIPLQWGSAAASD